jgi:hypothetical protein
MSIAPLNSCKVVISTNILVQYKANQNAGHTSPIRLNFAYSLDWRGTHVFKMAAKLTKECRNAS